MHVLKKFSPKEQEFIVNNGILLLKQCKLFNTITINQDENAELKIQKNKNNKLLNEMEQIEDKLNEKREKEIREIKNKYDIEVNRLEGALKRKDRSIENIEERTINKKDRENVEIKGMYETRIEDLGKIIEKKDKMIENIANNFDISIKTALNSKNEELNEFKSLLKDKENEIIRIKQIHESNNKGKMLENEVLNECINYNNKTNNIWKIIDTSKLAHKGDIQFLHKYAGKKFLIDLKNYSSSVQKIEIEKIKSDILNKDNDVDGGILISTNKISGKIDWEEEDIENKKLIYISHFKISDVGMIFRELNRLIDITKIKLEENNKEDLINHNVESYKKIKKMIIELNSEIKSKKELHKKLSGDDIELYIQNNSKKKINYDKIENGYKKEGRRSKFYSKYKNENGENVIKYFGSEKRKEIWDGELKKNKIGV